MEFSPFRSPHKLRRLRREAICRIKTPSGFLSVTAACVALGLPCVPSRAAQQNFNGGNSRNIEDLNNYDSLTVPTNDTTTDVLAVSATSPRQPQMTTSRSVAGFLFAGTSGGFSLTANTGAGRTLTLGSGGIQNNNTSGVNTIGVNGANVLLSMTGGSTFQRRRRRDAAGLRGNHNPDSRQPEQSWSGHAGADERLESELRRRRAELHHR